MLDECIFIESPTHPESPYPGTKEDLAETCKLGPLCYGPSRTCINQIKFGTLSKDAVR